MMNINEKHKPLLIGALIGAIVGLLNRKLALFVALGAGIGLLYQQIKKQLNNQ